MVLQAWMINAVNPAQDPNAMLAGLASQGVRDSKTDFLNTVASLPPLQSTLLRELVAGVSVPPMDWSA